MLTYAFLGSPSFARAILEQLISSYQAPALVVTQAPKEVGRGQQVRSTAVGECARARNLPVIETEDVNSAESVARITATKPDVLVVVAFGQRLKADLLKAPCLFPLNLHGSLLPAYRGAAPMQWAIWNGETTTGVSVQRMVKKMDAGDILLQKTIPIEDEDTAGTLLQKMVPVGGSLLVDSLRLLEREGEKVCLMPQDETRVTFAPKLDKSHGRIDWRRSALEVRNQIRATLPWPACEIAWDSFTMKVLEARVERGEGKAGTLVTDGKTFLHVQCGNGRLALTQIQPANKKPVSVEEFLRGFRGNLPASL
ncbi:MAG: methionyl-tRNA formyltransferase [Deltaproteobacteria bacterium]|nr:methionyl-tRNA formyltransferase [Deltaproteobacteria bacterium]MBI3293188.1 methionyl-tRNA formyltransferase [Deltaproteobacteria bacterium]